MCVYLNIPVINIYFKYSVIGSKWGNSTSLRYMSLLAGAITSLDKHLPFGSNLFKLELLFPFTGKFHLFCHEIWGNKYLQCVALVGSLPLWPWINKGEAVVVVLVFANKPYFQQNNGAWFELGSEKSQTSVTTIDKFSEEIRHCVRHETIILTLPDNRQNGTLWIPYL